MPYESSINTGLPVIPDPRDNKDFLEFTRLYNAIRTITLAVDSYTGNSRVEQNLFDQTPFSSSIQSQNTQKIFVQFTEAAINGQMVNLYNNAGVLNARLANAATPRQAHGFCITSVGVAIGDFAQVTLGGLCSAISGLVAGSTYYLSNTPGNVSVAAGTTPQILGFALSPTQMFFKPTLR